MDMIYKIIVIGDPMVGKTSLLNKYASNKFEEIYMPTIGANITKQSLVLDGIKFSLMIWDIAGQKDFYQIYKSYFNGTNGIIIVYDITRKITFENIDNWLNECLDNGVAHNPIVLVGNKLDLSESRVIEESVAIDKARSIGAPYFESSSLTGESVGEIFSTSARLAFDNNINQKE